MPRRLIPLLLFAIFSLAASAQRQQPAAPPQTPRQALIEIVTKGAEGITKHLTVEVQELLANSPNKSALAVLTGFSSMKPEKGLQTFDSGPVLFAYSEPGQHMKFEVRVENDDLAGDRDELQLSLHQFRDGQEEEQDFGLMASRFTVTLKQQQNIWRVSDISVNIDVPVGSPEFFKKTFLRDSETQTTSAGLTARAGNGKGKDAAPTVVTMPPAQVVTMLAYAENAFAAQHADVGFTCSLAELADTSHIMGVDRQVATGVYNGYRFSLSGCEGKPAGSFQITAEPLAAVAGAKAFCTDATHNVRSSEDGKGSSCLAFGKVDQLRDAGVGGVVFHSTLDVHTKPD